MKLGAHVSIAGGHTKALEKVVAMGGNCLQIFSASPRGWAIAKLSPTEIEEFITVKNKLKVSPIYFHASYLLNLADDGQVGKYSKRSLIAELNLAAEMGVKGSIIHLGSYKSGGENDELFQEERSKKYAILITNIKEVLAETPPSALFIIENSATKKIGMTVDEIAKIVTDLNDSRVRVCFDTCHLHATGYSLSTQENVDNFLKTFDSFIGLNKLEVWHMNDSKDDFNARRDRHENIGRGKVGTEVFRILLNHPLTKGQAFIIEVPGMHENGPDKENLDVLKSMVEV